MNTDYETTSHLDVALKAPSLTEKIQEAMQLRTYNEVAPLEGEKLKTLQEDLDIGKLIYGVRQEKLNKHIERWGARGLSTLLFTKK